MHHQSNTNALVLSSGGLPGQAASGNRLSHQPPGEQRHLEPTFEVDTGYIYFQDYHTFHPHFNCEVVKVQSIDRSNACKPLTDTFHMLNLPIDQLNDRLIAEAIRLPNLRSITFHAPLSWEVFIANYTAISAMTIDFLDRVLSLTTITLCADMFHDAVFISLRSHLCLRDVEIILPSSTSSDTLTHIGEVLNRGLPMLSQIEYFNIPLELVTATLLSTLGTLPSLRSLKTTDSPKARYHANFFIRSMPYLQVQSPTFFRNLQLLDVRGSVSQQDFFSTEILTNIFPNAEFIKA